MILDLILHKATFPAPHQGRLQATLSQGRTTTQAAHAPLVLHDSVNFFQQKMELHLDTQQAIILQLSDPVNDKILGSCRLTGKAWQKNEYAPVRVTVEGIVLEGEARKRERVVLGDDIDESYTQLIGGKEASVQRHQPKELLRSIPAQQKQQVELLNPYKRQPIPIQNPPKTITQYQKADSNCHRPQKTKQQDKTVRPALSNLESLKEQQKKLSNVKVVTGGNGGVSLCAIMAGGLIGFAAGVWTQM